MKICAKDKKQNGAVNCLYGWSTPLIYQIPTGINRYVTEGNPSVPMKQVGSDWTNFYEILYLDISRKSVEEIQASLKSDKKNGYFT